MKTRELFRAPAGMDLLIIGGGSVFNSLITKHLQRTSSPKIPKIPPQQGKMSGAAQAGRILR